MYIYFKVRKYIRKTLRKTLNREKKTRIHTKGNAMHTKRTIIIKKMFKN